MESIFKTLFTDFENTGLFNNLVTDYIRGDQKLNTFYVHRPELKSFEKAILERKNTTVNRQLLINVLTSQYTKIPEAERGRAPESILSLKNENTYTVTTGHQLCIFTGPLYFIYKLISTINLAEQLKMHYTQFNFIPVYWMASEDHDFEEINHLHLFSKRLTWHQDQKGVTGHISTVSLQSFFSEWKEILGDSSHAAYLRELFTKSYLEQDNLADATRYLVHRLLGKYGLIILDADDKNLKREFAAIMEDDLLHHHAFEKVNESNEMLAEHYKVQVAPREINLFYLTENSRERIVSVDDGTFKINNTNLVFSENEIRGLLHTNPERFSPNVVLRPLYQELILPDLAYVGGPGEIAYWLQYRTMFEFYKVPFPVLMLRNCLLWMDKETGKKISDLKLDFTDMFKETDELIKIFLNTNGLVNEEINFDSEKQQLNSIFEKLKERSANMDATLVPFVSGEQQKALHALSVLEQKIGKSQKRKHETAINQVKNGKEKLFPGNIPQERFYNFAMFYLKYGDEFFTVLKKELDPFKLKFNILIEM